MLGKKHTLLFIYPNKPTLISFKVDSTQACEKFYILLYIVDGDLLRECIIIPKESYLVELFLSSNDL